ncbi:hypothetical protein BGX38DRAFT_1276960 [Terfezia claveryi]|nr:hypothetical protein BGX38DRAFT_1276960 [Terfezia claveryi]
MSRLGEDNPVRTRKFDKHEMAMPSSIYSSGSASTSTESLSLPSLPSSIQRKSSNSYLHSAGMKLQSALTRHYHARAAHCARPRSLSQSFTAASPQLIPLVSQSQATGGTAAVCEEAWVMIADEEEEEESDEDFARRMARERQQEMQREWDMLELQMMLWQRWGRPKYT